MPATCTIQVNSDYTNLIPTGTAGTLSDVFGDRLLYRFGPGVGANQVDLPWSATGTLADSALTLILTALPGPGAAVTDLARLRGLELRNRATAAGATLTIAPGATHGWTAAFAGPVTIPPGGVLLIVAPDAAGYPVGAGTADQVTLTATGTVPYSVLIVGCSA